MIEYVAPSLPGIYVIHNTVTHSFYVGSTSNLRKRFNLHRTHLRRGSHHSAHLQHAWDKYGEASFAFMSLQIIEDKAQRLRLEQVFLDAFPGSYNISRKAISVEGIKRSESTRLKQRLSFSEDRKTEMSKRFKGVSKSPEHRAKIGAAQKGKIVSDETRQRMVEAWKRRRQRSSDG